MSTEQTSTDESDRDQPRRPFPLPYAAEMSLRLIRVAQQNLAEARQTRAVKSASVLVQHAGDDLERAINAHSDTATRELREIVQTALGPDLLVCHVEGARRMLEMLLDCLADPPGPEQGVGGAA